MLNPSSSRSRSWRFVPVTAVVGLLLLGLLLLRTGPPPKIALTAKTPGIGQQPALLQLHVTEPQRGISSLRVEVQQGETSAVVLAETYPVPPLWAIWQAGTREKSLELSIGRETLPGLRGGEVRVQVSAAGSGSPLRHAQTAAEALTLPVRLVAPQLTVVSTQHYATQGGSGLVVYRVDPARLEAGARDGVVAGDWFFPGYPVPQARAGERFSLFAIPYDLEQASGVQLTFQDAFGNETHKAFLDRFFPQPMSRDTIELNQEFLQKAVPEILGQTPELKSQGDLLADYLTINRDLRKANAATLRELALASTPTWQWSGAFLQLPNSKVTSAFADRRTYRWNSQTVDQQDHLGFDLASLRHAAVPASNRGTVRLARYFGIFGNSVVVDHGGGLMTLYSHLSTIAVTPGEPVEKGQELGRTGDTGLAAGDHLHYTVLLQGLPVNPLEWWDEQWINHRIFGRFAR